MDFRFNLWKSIVSIIVIIIWYYYLISFRIERCALMLIDANCKKGFSLIPSCGNCASSFYQIITDIIYILLPGIIIYIIWSLLSNNKKRRR